MGNRFLFLVTFLFMDIVSSQELPIEESGIVYYKMIWPTSGNTVDQINAELHFNDTETLFVWNKIGMDSMQQGSSLKTHKNEQSEEVHLTLSSVDEKGYQVYRNFRNKEIILRFPDAFPVGPYIAVDKWNPWKWTLINEHKEILGFTAQKAIAEFRGRIYIAWFTNEIPRPYGPWKLFGLPGLILEAHDTANVVVFKATKINYPLSENGVKKIQKPFESEIKSMKEYVHIQDYYNEMVAKKMDEIAKKTDPKSFFILGKTTTLEDIKKNRKRKFEIIYEWEEYFPDTLIPLSKENKTFRTLETVPQSGRIKPD